MTENILTEFQFARPGVITNGKEQEYVADALARFQIDGSSDYVGRFEAKLTEIFDREFSMAMSSAANALVNVLVAMQIRVGDEIIIPALAPAEVINAIRAMRALPVIVDVNPETWTIEPSEIRENINTKTRALIAVDFLGHPCNFQAIQEVTRRLPVIEFASCAFGSRFEDRLCGGNSLVGILDFGKDQTITTGEGGAILTDDAALFQRITTTHIGRMNGLSAAFGLGQLDHWIELVDWRITCEERLRKSIKTAKFRPNASWAKTACWLPVLTTNHKDSILEALRSERRIEASSISAPIDVEMSRALDISNRALILPAVNEAAACKELGRIVTEVVREKTMF